MIPFEGAFASRNPRATLLAGSFAFRAGNDGLAVSRFGWGDVDTSLANNTRTRPTQLLGFVLPVVSGNSAVRLARGVRFIRPGVGVTMMAGGDFWAKFDGGANKGDRVYASLVDGSPISGEADAAEATPWNVVTDTPPGGLAIISTTTQVTS